MKIGFFEVSQDWEKDEIIKSFENQELFVKLKKYKIAEILNMAPETFSRNLKKLKRDEIIFYDKNTFEVLDRNALSELFACCPSFKKTK